MKKTLLRYGILFLAWLSTGYSALGQVYPSTVHVQLKPPHSRYLSDYYAPTADNLKATILFNDHTEPFWEIKLRMRIESSSVHIQTVQDYTPQQPITMIPGVPLALSGPELENYFDYRNINLQGISGQSLQQNGRLPEGFYTFCFEVLDYNTGKVLSRKSCANAWLTLSEPPRIISPACGATLSPQVTQHNFQWQLFNTPVPNAAGMEYKLFVYEMPDPTGNPLTALTNGNFLQVFESDYLQTPYFLYDLAAPLLEPGKRYFYRVQAIDPEGKTAFKNDGLSEVCSFYYGYPEGGKIKLISPGSGNHIDKSAKQEFQWTVPDNKQKGQAVEYLLKIAEKKESQTAEEAFEQNKPLFTKTLPPTTSNNNQFVFISPDLLKRGVKYTWQVIAFSETQEIARSTIASFSGPSLVEYFYAGSHKIPVTSTTPFSSLEKFSGTGRLLTSPKDSIWVDIVFKDLHLIKQGDDYVLDAGEILHTIAESQPVEFMPAEKSNGKALFHPFQYRIDKQGLFILGEVQWHLPFPVVSSEVAIIKTEKKWMDYNNFMPLGKFALGKETTFALADPLGFSFIFATTSTFTLNKEKLYQADFDGILELPALIKGHNTTEPVTMSFHNLKQLEYNTLSDPVFNTKIILVDNTTLRIEPRQVVLDLSETESPGKLSGKPEYKVLYVNSYTLNLPSHPGQDDTVIDPYYDLPVEENTGNTTVAKEETAKDNRVVVSELATEKSTIGNARARLRPATDNTTSTPKAISKVTPPGNIAVVPAMSRRKSIAKAYTPELIHTDDDPNNESWISSKGLEFFLEKETMKAPGNFNTFPATFTGIKIDIHNSRLVDGDVTGKMGIPLISNTTAFRFHAPLTSAGLGNGTIDGLDGFHFIFNKGKKDLELRITINRAVFRQQTHLSMNVDIQWVALGAKMTGVSNLNAWGNYEVGFFVPNGVAALDHQIIASVSGYEYTMDVASFGMNKGAYAFAVSGKVVMGDDISGAKGPPVANIYSIASNNFLPKDYEAVNTQMGINKQNNAKLAQIKQVISNASSGTAAITFSRSRSTAPATAPNTMVSSKTVSKLRGQTTASQPGTPPESKEVAAVNAQYNQEEAAMNSQLDNDSGVFQQATAFLGDELAGLDSGGELGELLGAVEDLQGEGIQWKDGTVTLEEVIAVVNLLAALLPTEEAPKIQQMLDIVQQFDVEELQHFYAYLKDFDALVQEVAKAIAEKLTANLISQVNKTAQTFNATIAAKVNGVKDNINGIIDEKTTALVYFIADELAKLLQDDPYNLSGIIYGLAETVSDKLAGELTHAVNTQVNDKILAPIETLLIDNIAHTLNSAILAKTTLLIVEAFNHDKKPAELVQEVLADIPGIVSGIGTDIAATFNIEKVSGFIKGLGKGALASINVQQIIDELKQSVKGAVKEKIGELKDQAVAYVVNQVLLGQLGIDLPIDFTNTKKMLAEGGLKGLFSLDPVYLNLQSPILSLSGFIHYTPGDPVYGDVWAGDITLNVKRPEPFALQGYYMTGKVENHSYWFAQIDPAPPGGQQKEMRKGAALSKEAKPLENPVNLGVAKIMAASGRLYKGMREEKTQIVPDPTANIGAYMSFVFFDGKSDGENLRLAVSGEFNSNTSGDFTFTLKGDAQLKNKAPQVLVPDPAADILGTVEISYNSAEKHFFGYAAVTVHTEALCANASLLVDIKPEVWRVAIGSKENKVLVQPGCAGWAPVGWFMINETTGELGLGVQFSLHKTKELTNKWTIVIDGGVAFGLEATAQYNPTFALIKAGVWAELWLDIDAIKRNEKIYNLVSVYIAANLTVTFQPKPTKVSGRLQGEVVIVKVFRRDFDVDFERQL